MCINILDKYIYTHIWTYIILMFNKHSQYVSYFKILLVYNNISTPAHTKSLSEQTVTVLKSTQPLLFKVTYNLNGVCLIVILTTGSTLQHNGYPTNLHIPETFSHFKIIQH